MKKILSFFAAMLVAFAANAAVINITNETPDALRTALNSAADGDEIVMAAGTYVESNSNYIAFDGKAVTVKAAEGANVIIQPQVSITVSNGGHAIFENVKIDASRLQELATWYEHLLYVTDGQPNGCTFRGCEIYGYAVNNSMVYCSSANKVAAIKFDNCFFHDINKSILFIENTAGKPMVQVLNSTFANVIASVTDSYWAGIIDVRAAEATLKVDKCTFYNVVPMNTDYSAVSKIALAKGTVSNCIFMLPTALDNIRAMRGVTATNCITFNYLKDSGTGIHSSVAQTNCVQVDPAFVDPANGNFTLSATSPALTMNDGQPIGDPRWIPSEEPVETKYYVKNNWDGASDWTWKEMSPMDNGSGTYYILDSVVFGGTGVNVNTEIMDETATWIPMESFVDMDEEDGLTIGALDTVVFYYVPSQSASISYNIIGKYVNPVTEHTYTVAGSSDVVFGTSWDPTNTDNDMALVEGVYTWEKANLELAAGTIQFKVVEDYSWTKAWPAQDYNLNIAEAGIYTITITFELGTGTVNAVATKTGEAVVIPTIAMHGNFLGNWADTQNFDIAEGNATASLKLTIAVGNYEFGMRIGGSGNWTSNGVAFTRENNSAEVVAGSGNLKLAADAAGEYTFTWTYETNTLSIAFPTATAIQNTEVNAKAVKVMENGQMYIIKNGVKYNAIGTMIK